jgi:hypothetical protein
VRYAVKVLEFRRSRAALHVTVSNVDYYFRRSGSALRVTPSKVVSEFCRSEAIYGPYFQCVKQFANPMEASMQQEFPSPSLIILGGLFTFEQNYTCSLHFTWTSIDLHQHGYTIILHSALYMAKRTKMWLHDSYHIAIIFALFNHDMNITPS